MTERVKDTKYEIKGNEFVRCYKLMKRKWIYGLGFFFTLVAGAAPLLMNIIMADMMNLMTSANKENIMHNVKLICLNLVYVVIGMTTTTALALGFRMYLIPCLCNDIREKMFGNLIELDVSFFDETPPGILIGRLSEDVMIIITVYIEKFLQVVHNMTQAIVGIILAFCYSWRVSLAIFPAIPFSATVYIVFNFFLDKLWIKYNNCLTECIDKADEAINQIRTVKSFDCEIREAKIYTKNIIGIRNIVLKQSILGGTKDGIISILSSLMLAGLMYYTYWLIVRKPYLGMESGDMMILMMSMMLGTMGTSQALQFVDDFKKAEISAAKVLDIIDQKPKIDRHVGLNKINNQNQCKGKIEFKNVYFKYKTRDEYAVKNLSFVIKPGETVAFVGESGCGKTTTLQLLQRFYEIERGQILIDDVDITLLSQVFLRSQIATVPQGPVLFSLSIKDNIRYAKPDATDKEVLKASKTGNAHEFIMEMPENYDTKVKTNALSGGQKQRICISRAILMNRPILLLDEATAELDTESEQLIQQSIDVVRKGKMAIIVAHRLATVINADRILVFKDGKIKESGTHKKLMKKNGIYADLVKYQLE